MNTDAVSSSEISPREDIEIERVTHTHKDKFSCSV